MNQWLYYLRMFLRPRGREAFVHSLPVGATVLDVGCGSNSPQLVKSQRPDLYYVGVDVSDYHQSSDSKSFADEYILCEPHAFTDTIARLGQRFDAVISSHNIEHCDDPDSVLAAISATLRSNARLFMAWPAEHTTTLPSRAGCLNFYDDPTHQHMPKFDSILNALSANGVIPTFQTRAYRPIVPFLIGAALEPFAATMKRLAPFRSTWALYGFESVVWFQKTEQRSV